MKNKIDKFLTENKTEITGNWKYEDNTINSSNPLVRFSHRNRIKRCLKYVEHRLELGKFLDYGSGTGVFVSILNNIKPGLALGYEPFQSERFMKNTPIFCKYEDIVQFSPYQTITVFEVIEHMNNTSLEELLMRSNEILFDGKNGNMQGEIFFSAPIEIGPALILKEIHRTLLNKKLEYKAFEFLKAALFGISTKRIGDGSHGFGSHKGFDFRKTIKFIETKGWHVTILGYGPLSIKTWYGNSQVFFKAERNILA